MKENHTPTTDLYLLAIYVLTNALFVYKYVSRITTQPGATSLLYLILSGSIILLLYKKKECKNDSKTQTFIYFSAIALLATLIALLMFHFDPEKVRVGRYVANYDWISRFLDSQFPYTSHTRPSGFPFLFAMAIPFYILGDLGLFNIFSFIMFGVLVHWRYQKLPINKFRCILLLVTSPIFLFEVVVRSDIFSNMVALLFYLAVFEILTQQSSNTRVWLLGIIGGLLLSTRGIVLLVYILMFGYLFRKRITVNGLFFLAIFAGFILSLLPFLIWDWSYFTKFGPFSIQLSYIPLWLLIISIIGSLYCAMTIKSLKNIYASVAFMLLGVIGVSLFLSVLNRGWHHAVIGDGFDISYFCFALPFLLISLDFHRRGSVSPKGMFVLHPIE